MNKIYYTVEKQLDDIDGIGTTNGLKDILVYTIINEKIEELLYLENQLNTKNTEKLIIDFINKFIPGINCNNIELIKL